MRNRYRYLIIIAITVIVSGCSDWFDLKPQGIANEENTPAGSYESQVFVIYGLMRDWGITAGLPALLVESVRSDDADKGSTASDGSDQEAMYDNFQYLTSNEYLQRYWTTNYEVINRANTVIDAINQGPSVETDSISKAEARFFRAYAFFNLVRAFGDVPKIDFKVESPEETIIPKSPSSEIYTLIDNDLDFATKYLPQSWPSQYLGRLTWGAAVALHARTYMMRSDWNNMYTLSKQVINSHLYNLDTPYEKIFREEGENSSESVFELQCTATDAMKQDTRIGSQIAEMQGVRGVGSWDLGWAWNVPTQSLYEEFEAGDPRRDETFLYVARGAGELSRIPANKPWGEKPITGGDVISPYNNKKVYCSPELRTRYSLHGYWVNIRLIRYADVVLMAAESANELGHTSEALDWLEMIRARARGTLKVLPKVTDTDLIRLRDAIRHERRVELGMEYGRFYDLVRWDIASTVLGPKGYQTKHALLPIPQNEIDRCNGVLVQNPNYLQ